MGKECDLANSDILMIRTEFLWLIFLRKVIKKWDLPRQGQRTISCFLQKCMILCTFSVYLRFKMPLPIFLHALVERMASVIFIPIIMNFYSLHSMCCLEEQKMRTISWSSENPTATYDDCPASRLIMVMVIEVSSFFAGINDRNISQVLSRRHPSDSTQRFPTHPMHFFVSPQLLYGSSWVSRRGNDHSERKHVYETFRSRNNFKPVSRNQRHPTKMLSWSGIATDLQKVFLTLIFNGNYYEI